MLGPKHTSRERHLSSLSAVLMAQRLQWSLEGVSGLAPSSPLVLLRSLPRSHPQFAEDVKTAKVKGVSCTQRHRAPSGRGDGAEAFIARGVSQLRSQNDGDKRWVSSRNEWSPHSCALPTSPPAPRASVPEPLAARKGSNRGCLRSPQGENNTTTAALHSSLRAPVWFGNA